MHKAYTKANSAGIVISITLGLIGYQLSEWLPKDYEKATYTGALLTIFTTYCFFIERAAFLDLDGGYPVGFKRRPLLRLTIALVAYLVFGGTFLYFRLPLSSPWDFAIWSMLSFSVVSGVFEFSKFLRIKQ